MVPVPDLQALLDAVRTDAPSADPLDELAQASRVASELDTLADTLLGHFVDQCRRAGHSWSEISAGLGVTRQAAHKRFSGPTPAFDRFTPRAAAVVEGASEVARGFGHSYVGTEHLLLALFDSRGSVAAQMLAEAGVDRAACEEQVLARTTSGPVSAGGRMPFTPRAVAALRSAVEEAIGLGHNYIGTEHVLLALFADPENLAAKILSDLRVSCDDLRSKLTEIMAALTAH